MKIVLYSTGCANCSSLAAKLNAKKISYEVCSDMDVIMSKGLLSVPALEVDGVLMNNKQASEWVKAYEVIGDEE